VGGRDLVGGTQPPRTHRAGDLDVDLDLLVEAARAHGRLHAPGVAGQVVEVAQGDLDSGEVEAPALDVVDDALDRSGTGGAHHRQGDAGEVGRQVGVADDEGAGEVGVPPRPALVPRGDRVGQWCVAGREGGGVVDEAVPERGHDR